MIQARPVLRQVEQRPDEVRAPGPPLSGVRRLIVVRRDRLGDLVLTLPAVAALRETYPQTELILMVAPRLAPLARWVRCADDVIEAAPDAAGLRRQLARARPELLVSISRDPAVAWAAWRARVRWRVGTGQRYYSPLFTRRVRERRRSGGRHELEYALSFAHRVGAPAGPVRFPLELPRDVDDAATRWLASVGIDPPFVVLHPGSGGSCPSWPAEHYARLAQLLGGAGRRAIVTRGAGDPDLEGCELPSFSGDLPTLAGLLRRAALVVSNSTGPVHLAAALGTPTLAIHAPWPSCGVVRWGPYSERGWALVAEHPRASRWTRRQRRRDGQPLLGSLQPELVWGIVEERFL